MNKSRKSSFLPGLLGVTSIRVQGTAKKWIVIHTITKLKNNWLVAWDFWPLNTWVLDPQLRNMGYLISHIFPCFFVQPNEPMLQILLKTLHNSSTSHQCCPFSDFSINNTQLQHFVKYTKMHQKQKLPVVNRSPQITDNYWRLIH